MTGPEHYQEAEQLVVRAHNLEDQKRTDYPGKDRDERRVDFMLRRADVHATLAAAAAQIELAVSMQADNGVSVEWLEAIQ